MILRYPSRSPWPPRKVLTPSAPPELHSFDARALAYESIQTIAVALTVARSRSTVHDVTSNTSTVTLLTRIIIALLVYSELALTLPQICGEK